jgi:hypothetical protein
MYWFRTRNSWGPEQHASLCTLDPTSTTTPAKSAPGILGLGRTQFGTELRRNLKSVGLTEEAAVDYGATTVQSSVKMHKTGSGRSCKMGVWPTRRLAA